MTETTLEDAKEELGRSIDELDDLAHALKTPVPDSIHVNCLREQLPELVAKMKRQFAAVIGEDPWETHP